MLVLVAYASTHGHTGRIARRIADGLSAHDLVVDVQQLPSHGSGPSPEAFDAVVVAGSLHAGHHQASVVRWIKHHRDAIAARPNGLVSVSLTAAEQTEEAQAEAQACVDTLVEDTGWIPDVVSLVGGALQYREYDVFTRLLMRTIARHHGQSGDVSHDIDLTDWDAVDRFAADLAARLAAESVAR